MTAISTQKSLLIKVENPDKINSAATDLLEFCGDVKVITFSGNLGAGKTTFIKTLCKMLGVVDAVSSPTFSIINEYRNSEDKSLYHFDFYRLKTTREAEDTGCVDYFFSGNHCFIEWPEIITSLLPDKFVQVDISLEGETRIINATLITR